LNNWENRSSLIRKKNQGEKEFTGIIAIATTMNKKSVASY
jgi:hypothetical protein